jgi:hypothetical protein
VSRRQWQRTDFGLRISDCARPPRLSEQARDGGQGSRIGATRHLRTASLGHYASLSLGIGRSVRCQWSVVRCGKAQNRGLKGRGRRTDFGLRISDCARPPRLSEQARDPSASAESSRRRAWWRAGNADLKSRRQESGDRSQKLDCRLMNPEGRLGLTTIRTSARSFVPACLVDIPAF